MPFGWLTVPDSNDHGANMGPTWVLSAPGGPHVGPMNLALGGLLQYSFDGINQRTDQIRNARNL